ncbi:MAG: hypothetical protein WA118_12605 [Carboxydocellales bacterium]
MEWFLIILGVCCLGLGLITEHPKFRDKVIRPWVERQWAQEEAKIKQTRQEAEKAREDVAMLLAELDRASDKVVELMTGWADKAQEHVQATYKANEPESLKQISTQQKLIKELITLNENNHSSQTKAKSSNKQKRETKTKGNKNNVPIESAKSLRIETSNPGQGIKNFVMKDKYITVLHLAEQGISIADIAQSVKIGRGEVQLLLDLQNRGDKR